jgi:NAD kinase
MDLRAAILMDHERPKVGKVELVKLLKSEGMQVSGRRADFGLVVGGDGIFSYYGRITRLPLLFVAVRSSDSTASKGYFSEVDLNRLPTALKDIREKRYEVIEYKRLTVAINGSEKGEVFTDVYLEKGADSNCLRYQVQVRGKGATFIDSAIANGVIISTSAGATGYYSYLDKLSRVDRLDPHAHSRIGDDEIGVCHIAPMFNSRGGKMYAPLRYTVPWNSNIRIRLTRDADARLFGITKSRKGVRIKVGDYIDVRPSTSTTRVIRLSHNSER